MGIMNYIKNPKRVLTKLDSMKLIHLSDETKMRLEYEINTNKKLNIENPETFNEKLQWLKLYNRKPEYTKLVDKYEAKKFVAGIIGEEYIIPIIGVYDRFKDIDFEKLPDKFVMKCTHDSGGVIICKNKATFNIKLAKKKIGKFLKRDYYNNHREWPYKNVKPRILIEEYMEDKKQSLININQGGMLNDYKFWTFSGVPKAVYVTIKGKNIYENFYDMEFEKSEIEHKAFGRYNPEFTKPEAFDKMKEIVATLANAINAPFLRVDLFYINGKIYFSEFTFYDWGGLQPLKTEIQEKELGKWIDLNGINK